MSRWTIDKKEDIITELELLCEQRNISFKGFVGEWKCGYTKLKLFCEKHGSWETTNISNFITLGYGCDQCRRQEVIIRSRISDADAAEHFNKKGDFPTHTFKRDTETRTKHQTYPYWKVWCSVCSEDEFSKVGVSPEYFTSSTPHLNSGKVPCRCSKSYRWTERELLYLIDKSSKVKGYNVTNIKYNKNGKLLKSCKLEYICEEGHQYYKCFTLY